MQNIHSFILLGKTGDGKSSLAKFLSGTKKEDKFKICDNKYAGTREVEQEIFSFEGSDYSVIDTPGFFDPDEKKIQDNDKKIINCIEKSSNPISTILIVVNFQEARINEQIQICIKKISELFPMEDFWKHVILILTKSYPSPDEPESFEEQKKIWEADIDLFKKKIDSKLINNNNPIKVFYINNSKKSIEKGSNISIKRDILNCIKNSDLFYISKREISIPKERVDLTRQNDEPDEKYGDIELRRFRSYKQIIYALPNNTLGKGPTIEIKTWTEKIEYFIKFDGQKKKKMKHLYIDDQFKGDYLVSYEYLDINTIDHWEISCKCGFKDKTKYANSKDINRTVETATGISACGIGGFIVGLLAGPVGWGALIIGGIGAGIAGIGIGKGAGKISEKITESNNIGLNTFNKGCPKCGKIELEVIPIFKN